MSDLKELRLTEISEQYPGVPRDILGPAVDAAGLVDTTLLGHVLRGYLAGKEGRVDRQDGERVAQRQNLKVAYAEAVTRGDHVSMVSLKRQLHELGESV
ncbi:MAG: hypothetical protein D4R73_11130 [Deltaproteobacteria bacterium]|nr:MAG: hypothetical protein D4R73_11130 [Deltaproteobacteria bacterium]